MVGLSVWLVLLAGSATQLVFSLPMNYEAAEPMSGGFMNVQDTLQAAADRLRAQPSYVPPAFAYSPKTRSGLGSFSSSPSSDATERFLTEPNHVWDSWSRLRTPHYMRSGRESPSKSPDSRSTSSVKSSPDTTNSGPYRVAGRAAGHGRLRHAYQNLVQSVRARFRPQTRRQRLPQTLELPLATQKLPRDTLTRTPSVPSPLSSLDTSVNDHHPYFGAHALLGPEYADRSSLRYIAGDAEFGNTKPSSRNAPYSFVKSDTHLARLAEGLTPLRVPVPRSSAGEENRLEGISDLYFKRKGEILPKIQVARASRPSLQASRPPRTEEELNILSRLYFARTGHAIPSLQTSPPPTDLAQQIVWPHKQATTGTTVNDKSVINEQARGRTHSASQPIALEASSVAHLSKKISPEASRNAQQKSSPRKQNDARRSALQVLRLAHTKVLNNIRRARTMLFHNKVAARTTTP